MLYEVITVRAGEAYAFEADGQTVVLNEEDLLIEPVHKQGFVVETEGAVSVILDTTLSQTLIEEGFVRERNNFV